VRTFADCFVSSYGIGSNTLSEESERMKHPILILLFLLMAATSTAQMPVDNCDGFRRKVSTLTDADTLFLDDPPEHTTISKLTQLPFFDPFDTTSRQEAERHTYYFKSILVAVKRERNGDIYLVLRDPYTDSTMLATIPDPECPDVHSTSFWQEYYWSRDMLTTYNGEIDTTLTQIDFPYPVSIIGIPFYNRVRGEAEQAMNNIEIHPVLRFNYFGDTAVDDGSSLPLKMNLSQIGE
jgi:hypothetical protein